MQFVGLLIIKAVINFLRASTAGSQFTKTVMESMDIGTCRSGCVICVSMIGHLKFQWYFRVLIYQTCIKNFTTNHNLTGLQMRSLSCYYPTSRSA